MAKNYIKGSFREFRVGDGTKLVMSVLVSDLNKIANERGYASIVVQERKEADQYGNTHYMFENDYKPQEGAAKKAPAKQEAMSKKADLKAPKYKETDDSPF